MILRSPGIPRQKGLLCVCGHSGFEDVINDQLVSQCTRILDTVVGGRNYDYQRFVGKDKNLVAASAVHSVRTQRACAKAEGLEPPQVNVIGIFSSVGMRAERILYPFSTDNPVAIPDPSIQIELFESREGEVATSTS